VPATGCTIPFIAASVIAAVNMPEEETKDKRIHIAEFEYTGQEILDALEEASGTKFEIARVPIAELMGKFEAAKMESRMREVFVLPVVILNFGAIDGKAEPCGAGLLSDGLTWNAKGLLTQKRKTVQEVAREVMCLGVA